ncbi:translation elongation factor Ts (EF-Ts) [Mycoplasmopsis mustelae]|uniref:Elongation factor Ts n=1 Tax=Mycoplasmopsis mustelae TaxID=171289 RepID=A0A4R7UC18_9BACT|nr:translation elongation factor Ts [Mycoplasmopsis mustelae]TDV23291.1 translation elongation factor Ts (EF-Ts) [Mycoplasmopsis mustelae]
MSVNKLELIKELRQRTNSALIDVKKALEATNYDIEAAINWLKENGIVKAAKKAGRIAAEGAVFAVGNNETAVLIEINSETDFVAKNEKFLSLVKKVATAIFKAKAKTLEEALVVVLENKQTVEQELLQATSVIGEKISLRRVKRVSAKSDESLGVYVHVNNQVAAIVKIKGSHSDIAKNVAMHVSAMNPEVALVSDLSVERLEKLKLSFEKPVGFDSKPAKIQEKIQEGWLSKQLSEFVLEKQPFVMDDSITVAHYLKNCQCELVSAIRFEVGEGIEKTQSDFAAEVADMLKH